MKPAKAIKEHLLFYPRSYQTVGDAFYHIFLVAGCGYEWSEKTGELINVFPVRQKKNTETVRSALTEKLKKAKASQQLETERVLLNYDFTVKNINRLVRPQNWNLTVSGAYLTSYYCLKYKADTSSCLVNSMPANISPKWEFAAKRFLISLRDSIHLGLDSRRHIYGEVFFELEKALLKFPLRR